MLIDFFYTLRAAKVPVSVREFLTLLEAMKENVVGPASDACTIDDFYHLSRTVLVKDEKHFDKFDKAFGAYFKGVEMLTDFSKEVPLDWLEQILKKELTPEQKAAIEKFGYDKLMDRLKQLLEEQKGRHEGGNKWIGTGGTSPFGNGGQNPEGIRIGGEGGNRSAVKVWDQRAYRDYDSERELGTRNIKVALRRLRRWAREGNAEELDLPDTIRSTARNAGFLDLKMVPERHNNVKVLLFLDVGGSMDPHIKVCEELFSAARSEFKNLEYFYFHNCLYEEVWQDNVRRRADKVSTFQVMHTFPHDYKVIFVGDATMSPYEIVHPGGSVEHWNEESGETWLQRMMNVYPKSVWLNPVPEGYWDSTPSIQVIKQLFGHRMFPMTLDGLDRAMKELSR